LKLGSENKNKTYAALALGVLALGMVVYRISNPAGLGSASTAPTTPQPSSTQAPATPGRTAAPRRPTTRVTATSTGKKGAAVASLDPTLRLGLLRSTEETQYTGKARNIFQAYVEPVAPIAPAIKQPVVPQGPPPPPPPPPINLKFFGFASKPGEPKRIFLSQGEDVFIAGEGDIVDRRYRIVHITPSSVEVEDVLNNNRQSIPLTQG
jgi:hypothetical protein